MEPLDAVSLERCGLADGSAQNGSRPAMLTSDWLEEELDTLLRSSPATDVLQLYVEAEEGEEVHVMDGDFQLGHGANARRYLCC